jgi:hypothetical protein
MHVPALPYLNPLQQQVIDMRNLQNKVKALQQANTVLPMLNADPGAASGINMWILTDGRVHVRLPNGTVKELAPGTTTGSSSTTPVTPPVPTQTYIQSWYPTWTQAYTKNGTVQSASVNLPFGYSGNATSGSQMSILAFPSSMTTQLSGCTINYIHLWMNSIRTADAPNGGTVHIGGGSYSGTPPSTYTSGFENQASGGFPGSGLFKVVLPVYFYTPFTGGSINGLTLNAPNNSFANAGEVVGGGGYTGGSRLEISYTS